MISTNKGSFSLYIFLLALLIIFNSCEDPGSVGSEYVDRPELQYDTLSISDTNVLNYNGYSGRLTFIPMGSYSDPIFGDVTANAMFKPTINATVPDSIELGDNFSMTLNISLDSLETYGDTLSSPSFTLYEITQPWRGRALRLNEDIQYGTTPIGTFSIGADASSITVNNLSDAWVDEYKSYFDSRETIGIDSTYNYEFGGLIAVPDQGSSKIEFSLASQTQFNIISESGIDTIAVPLRDWGYVLDRGQQNLPQNTFALHSTLESMLMVTMPLQNLIDGTASRNILRADVVFHEAEDELVSSLPANHQRLRVNGLNMGPVATEDPVYQYQFGTISFFGTKNTEDSGYQINVTNYINNVLFGDESREELVLGIGSSAGALRSTIFYDHTAPEDLRPKIIITSLVD